MAYYFRLPKITDLTMEQQMALDEVNPIALSGQAGSGKTVVSLWRHLRNMEALDKFSLLLTFTKTLKHYLIMTLSSIEDKEKFKQKNIFPPSEQVFNLQNFPFNDNWKVDEIIIDEAQDLSKNTIEKIKYKANIVSYGADFNQQLYNNKVNESEIKELLPYNVEYDLHQNFRNTYYILNFVKATCPTLYIPKDSLEELEYERKGIKPICFITNSFDNEIEQIIEIINEFYSETHNIAILLPFGDSNSEQTVENYYQALRKKGVKCSKYYNKMHTDYIEIDNIHITTFKSVKGLEFDTLIIPQLDKMKWNIENLPIIKEKDYYVAFTRAKTNLYLFSKCELDFINEDVCEIKKLDNKNTIQDTTNEDIPF